VLLGGVVFAEIVMVGRGMVVMRGSVMVSGRLMVVFACRMLRRMCHLHSLLFQGKINREDTAQNGIMMPVPANRGQSRDRASTNESAASPGCVRAHGRSKTVKYCPFTFRPQPSGCGLPFSSAKSSSTGALITRSKSTRRDLLSQFDRRARIGDGDNVSPFMSRRPNLRREFVCDPLSAAS
jgi:hypothetical protein